jgi:hypothetical protein
MENIESTENMTTPDPAPTPGPNLVRIHASTMDSVNLINSLLTGTSSQESESTIARNVAHIYTIKAKYKWSEVEIEPFVDVIADVAEAYPSLATEADVMVRIAELQSSSDYALI